MTSSYQTPSGDKQGFSVCESQSFLAVVGKILIVGAAIFLNLAL